MNEVIKKEKVVAVEGQVVAMKGTSKTANSRHWFWGNTYFFGNGNLEVFECHQVQILLKIRYIHAENFYSWID